jgi:hypothetical protein
MKARATAAAVMLVWLAAALPAPAHRLDEYLQDTSVSLHADHVDVQVRLTPGVAVLPAVLAMIDTDADGKLSPAEQQAYASQVLRDLSLAIDGHPLQLRLLASTFPSIEEMKEGLGVIVLDLSARVPPGPANRRLTLENRHQSQIAAYLMNCLVTDDADIRVTAQRRNYQQSTYELDYTQAAVSSTGPPAASWSTLRFWLTADAVVLIIWLTTFWRCRRRRRSFLALENR